jgi:hypothetical protein
MVVAMEGSQVTEIGLEEAEKRKEGDAKLASTARKLLWSRKTPFLATFGIVVVFSVRVTMCDYTEEIPEGLDFQWYGNHCGPGHGNPDAAVKDELDAACKRHDEAYREAAEGSSTD